MDWQNISILLVSPIGIFVHVIALVLLYDDRKIKENSKYHFVSLCLTEIGLTVGSVIDPLGILFYINPLIKEILKLFGMTSLSIMYMSVMFFITLDRLLAVYLNIKYNQYCTEKRTLVVLIIVFVISIIFYLCILISNRMNPWDYGKFLMVYIYPIFQAWLLLTAFVTYLYIFVKVRENRLARKKIEKQISRSNDTSNFKKYSRSNFNILVPGAVLLTLILFMTLPTIIYCIFDSLGSKMKVPYVIYVLGWITDPMIYIFSIKSFRKKLLLKIQKLSCRARDL